MPKHVPKHIFKHGKVILHVLKVFGAAGDQLTRYMYTLGSSMAGNKGTGGEVGTLLDLARQEVRPLLSLSQASLVPSLTQMAKRESSGKVGIEGPLK